MYKFSLVSLPVWSFSSVFYLLLLYFILVLAELQVLYCSNGHFNLHIS